MKKQEISHPDHSAHLKRLNRARGQLDGVEKMILERRYCPDIIFQLRAVAKALQSMEAEIMRTHIHGCVKTAIDSRDAQQVNQKIEEIMDLVKK